MTEKETKNCQNCKQAFTIESEDFEFYKKIDVPAPTWCPWCRMQRRMASAADSTTLYQRICEAPTHSEKIVSVYPETTSAPVYDPKFWTSDGWDAMAYGKEYDFKKTFFIQLKELLDVVPVRSTEVVNSVNCEYSLGVTDSKNCYLCSGTFGSDNCIYGHTAVFSKECIDVTLATAVEQGYDLFSVDKSFKVTSSIYSDELVDCDFMYDSRGCTDCLGCIGLRNRKYCIFNKQYSKEEYKKERAKYNLGSYKMRQDVLVRFRELLAQYPRKFAVIRNAPNSTGDNLINVKNCKQVFQALNDAENCKYSFVVGYNTKDSQDIAGAGLKSELLYESVSVVASSNVAFSYRIRNSQDIQYSRECFDSSHLFACVGLKSKKYCIFNRQYSKIEYEGLLEKIRDHMNTMPFTDACGRIYKYGEAWPTKNSLIPYNSSWAKDYFPLTKEQALAHDMYWYEAPTKEHAPTIGVAQISDNVQDTEVSITDEIIQCANYDMRNLGCIGVFRIITSELEFYKKFNIALPRTCPICRYREHLKNINPCRLWHRQCDCVGTIQRTGYENTRTHKHGESRCLVQFETAYEPVRPELLYCESCYTTEIL